jgi:hypothetical protein
MMVGGYIYPECEIATIPLRDDLSRPNPIQDKEWQDRAKRWPLPRLVTIDDRQQTPDNGRLSRYPPTNPNAQQVRQVMPDAPTSAGPGGNGQTGNGQTGYGQTGYGQQGYGPGVSARNNTLANTSVPGQNPVPGYTGVPTPVATPTPTVNNNYLGPSSISSITSRYGLGGLQNPMMNPSAGNKPYSDYQRPTGYSPWQNLYLPSNNGTVDPYTAYVRPAIDQQNFNSHISEQINGVQTRGYYYGSGTPGMEGNIGSGNGLVNPQLFQTYPNYNPMNQQYPRY